MNNVQLNWLKRAMRVAFPFLILGLLWQWLDGQKILTWLSRANGWWLFLALVLLSVQLIASAFRWQLTAHQLGQGFTRRRAVGEYYLSMLCNLTLPGGVLGDAGRAWRGRTQAGLGTAVSAVVIERLAGQVAMISVLTLAITGTAFGDHWLLGLAVVMVVAALLLWRGPGWLKRFGHAIRKAWFTRHAWPGQLSLTVVILFCSLAAFAACAAAIGVSFSSLSSALVVLPLTLMVMALPVSVAGWGLRESAAATLWPMAAISSEAAVAASILYGLVATTSVLPGLVTAFGVRPREQSGAPENSLGQQTEP
ncbi:MAG: lysylphosphatidylglycerol synthase transmembrane domain-containing protein [Orrella sp.]